MKDLTPKVFFFLTPKVFFLLIALLSKEPFFATIKKKYSKITKWWADHGIIFSPF
jgi:hypothetical protein